MARHIEAQQASNPAPVKADASGRMTGAERRAARTGRPIYASANGTSNNSSQSTTFNATANEMGEKLLQNLGAERQSLFGVTTGYSYKGETIIDATTTAEGKLQAIRDVIADKSPTELTSAIAKLDPSNKDLQDFAKIVQNDPKMAEALKSAIVKDPTMLEKMPELLNAKGDSKFSLKDLNKGLSAKGTFGDIARNQFTRALNVVADTDADFNHLLKVGNKGKDLFSKGFSGFLDMAKNNPDEMIQNLFDGVDMDPQLRNMLAGLMKEFMPLLVAFIDPNGFMLSPYVELGGKISGSLGSTGAKIFQTDADGQTSHFSLEDFKEKFEQVTAGTAGNLADPEHFKDVLKAIDPKLEDEMKEIGADPSASKKFNFTVQNGGSYESFQKMAEQFYVTYNETNNTNTATNKMGLGT